MAQTRIQHNVEIKSMVWSCKKFFNKPDVPRNSTNGAQRNLETNDEEYNLALSFVDGTVCLLRSYDDLFPTVISTDLLDIKLEWSNENSLLAVAGYRMIKGECNNSYVHINLINFYNINGVLIKTVMLDYKTQPLSAIVWGNKDTRIYVACGQMLFVGCVDIK